MAQFLGYLELGTIVSTTKPGADPLFLHFTCFTSGVLTAIVISLVAVSLALSIKSKSLTLFGEYLWNSLIMIFSPVFHKLLKKKSGLRLLIALWMLSALVINTQWTVFLLDYMSAPNPVLKIDSLQDLADKPDIKVFAANDSTLFAYADKELNDSLAAAIRKKIIVHKAEMWLNPEFIRQVAGLLKDGSHSFHLNRMSAIFVISRLIETLSESQRNEFTDIIHISSESGGYLPTAMAVKEDNELINQNIDSMFVLIVVFNMQFNH